MRSILQFLRSHPTGPIERLDRPTYIKDAKRQLDRQADFTDFNVFISLPSRDAVQRAARTAEASWDKDKHTDPFGRLVALKDNICTSNFPTTAASGILKNFTSPYEATVVKQLRGAGAIIAGKTNMDEFGMGSHSTNSYFGRVEQLGYEGEQLSAGGSSGGSAMAVAWLQCWAALGTDTGGSVRLPAAYTGVMGFKPSYGLLSRWGVIAYANSLDTVGILGSRAEDVRAIFNTLNVHDPQDPTSLVPSTRARFTSEAHARETIGHSSINLRIGIPMDYNIDTLHPTVRKAWVKSLRLLEMAGCTLHPVSLPATQHALSTYYVLAPAEASSNLAKYDGVRYGSRAQGVDGTPESILFAKTRGQGFGPEVRRRILLGAFSLSAQAIDNYFIQAQKVRRLVQQDFDNVFSRPNPLITASEPSSPGNGVDILLCPTAPTLPPTLSELEDQDPVKAYMNDVFTVPASLAGLPAISVPVSFEVETENEGAIWDKSKFETVGIQLIGQFGDDHLVLRVAELLHSISADGLR